MTPASLSRLARSLRRLLPVVGSALLPLLVHAQLGADPFGGGVVNRYIAPARDLPKTIVAIVNFVLILVGVIALAFLVYGGFRYITSRGDEGELELAKATITNAVIGIVVIGIAAAIVNFVIGAILSGE